MSRLADVFIATQAKNTFEKKGNNEYDLTFKDARTYLKLYYDGASANDVVLTRKVLSESGNSELNGNINYGLTKVEAETNNPVGFYPIGYSTNALDETWKTWYDGAIMNYDVYVVGGEIYNVKLNFKIELDNE